MRNMVRPRKVIRAEALTEVLRGVRSLGCPEGKDAIWEGEFANAVDAIARMLENQIAQAEGRVIFRRRKPPRSSGGGGSEN